MSEILVENIPCLHLANVHTTPNRLIDYHQARKALTTKLPPFLTTYHPGAYIFVIQFQEEFKKEDVYRDALGPWNSNGSKLKSSTIEINGKRYRQARLNHPTIVAFDDEKAVLAYNFTHAVDKPGEAVDGRKMSLPSTMNIVKKELQGRTVKSTHKLLKNTSEPVEEHVIRNASQSVGTCIKSKTGPVRPTSIGELLDIAAPYKFRCQVENQNDTSKPIIIFTTMFDQAISLFAKDCPTREQLNTFQNWMKHEAIDDNELPSPGDFNYSQFVPGMENQVSIDTTFGLSHLFVTLIIGKLGSYRTKRSHKDRPIMLGLMLHSMKNSKSHEFFGESFAEAWKRLAPGKSIPSFIRDGESALAQVTKDKVFSDATQLRCDLHLIQNLLGPKGIAHKDARYLVGIAQGRHIKPGLLQMTSREDFTSYLNKLATKAPNLYRKIVRKEEEIFTFHSKRSKLIAGCGARYSTTNSSEGYNQMVKNYVPRKMPGDQVLKNLIQMHKDEMGLIEEANNNSNKAKVEYHERIPFQWPPFMRDASTADQDSMSRRSINSTQEETIMSMDVFSENSFAASPQVGTSFSTDSMSDISPHLSSQVINNKKRSRMTSTFSMLQKAHMKSGDGSKRKGKQQSKGNFKRTCYESLERRAIDTTIESLESRSSCPPQPLPGYEDEDIPLMELSRSMSQVPWEE